MYLVAVIGPMAVLPIISIVVELLARGGDVLTLAGKWFVFWAVGVRLLVAGLHQVAWPAFTVARIFGSTSAADARLVVEIGFGNIAIGVVAALSLFFTGWTIPAAAAGCIFFGLAGAKHVFNHDRKADENLALVSDLAIAVILVGYLAAIVLTGGA